MITGEIGLGVPLANLGAKLVRPQIDALYKSKGHSYSVDITSLLKAEHLQKRYHPLRQHSTMNCPSRTDDAELEHPSWNQNPPFLAADLTTCQDLNGIANSRERKGDSDDGIAFSPQTAKQHLFEDTPDPVVTVASWARFSSGESQLLFSSPTAPTSAVSALSCLAMAAICDPRHRFLMLTTYCSHRTYLAPQDGCQW